MIESTIDYKIEKFLITDEPVMKLVVDVLQVLNKIGKITIKGKGDLCPAAVSVSNIIIQNGGLKSEKISVSSETLDDGRLVSIIEIIITKIQS
jgi:DNA-binding protein